MPRYNEEQGNVHSKQNALAHAHNDKYNNDQYYDQTQNNGGNFSAPPNAFMDNHNDQYYDPSQQQYQQHTPSTAASAASKTPLKTKYISYFVKSIHSEKAS